MKTYFPRVYFRILVILFLIISLAVVSCVTDPELTDPNNNGIEATSLTPLPDAIPYQKLGSGKIVFQRFYQSSSEPEFYVIDVDNGKSTGFKLNRKMKQPYIARSGNKIACSVLNPSVSNPAWNIYIMNLDGTGSFAVSEPASNAHYPTWSFDGSKIIYYTTDPGVAYIQSAVENATDRAELIKFTDAEDPNWEIKPSGGISASNQGKFVAISKSTMLDGVIGIVPYIGKAGASLLHKPDDIVYQGLVAWTESPVFSPDGSKIAFYELYHNPMEMSWIGVSIGVMDADGTNVIQVGGTSGYTLNAGSLERGGTLCWSPDGTKILFTIPDSPTSLHLYVLNVDGSNEGGYVKVTDMPNTYDSEVSWSY